MSELDRLLITRRAALSALGTTVAGAVAVGATGSIGSAAAAATTRTARATNAARAMNAARAAGACTLVAEQEIGPFYVA